MSDVLMKYETIDSPQIEDIMAGREVRAPKGWSEKPKPEVSEKSA
jgi:cell division protease FtsH